MKFWVLLGLVISPIYAQTNVNVPLPSAEYPNFSLWPKRPAELIQGRRLIQAGRLSEAIPLLEKASKDLGPGGFEASQLLGNLRMDALLTPGASSLQKRYRVKSGDSLFKIAAKELTPPDLILQLNALSDPSKLKIGQELWILPLNFKLVINLKTKVAMLVNGEEILNAWKILGAQDQAKESSETTIKNKYGNVGGMPVTAQSPTYSASNKSLVLSERGLKIAEMPSNGNLPGSGYYLSRADVNEMALLLRPTNVVEIIR